jgi:NitT/TauT family transport system permease protein
LGFLLAWGIVAGFELVDPLFLPTPWAVGESLLKIFFYDRSIYSPLFCSGRRMLFGFGLGISTGVFVGILLGSSKRLYASFEVLIDFFRSIPSTAFLPFFMLWLGVGDGPKIAVVIFVCFFVCLINSAFGVVHSSPSRLFVAQVMGASRSFRFFKVRLFEAMPSISSGIRVSISYAIVLVVVSEMFIGTDVGLGRLIYDAHFSYKISEMYAVIVVTGSIGYIANKLYAALEGRVLHWSGKAN